MKQKYLWVLGIIIIVGATLIFTYTQQKLLTKCQTNYVLDDEHILDDEHNPVDLETVQKFNVRKECLDGSEVKEIWIQEEQKYTTDSPYEKVMFCESENKFLVVKSLGLIGGSFYLYEGKPCK